MLAWKLSWSLWVRSLIASQFCLHRRVNMNQQPESMKRRIRSPKIYIAQIHLSWLKFLVVSKPKENMKPQSFRVKSFLEVIKAKLQTFLRKFVHLLVAFLLTLKISLLKCREQMYSNPYSNVETMCVQILIQI